MPNPRLFKPNTHKSLPKCRLGLCKYYPGVDLCKMVTGKNHPLPFAPKLGVCRTSATTTFGGSPGARSAAKHLFLLPECQTSLTNVCASRCSELQCFYQPLFNPWEGGLGGKLHIFLTRVHFPTDTGSSPFHDAALSRAFSSPSKPLLAFSTVSPHPAHSFHVHRPMALSLTLALIMKCVVCCCSMRTECTATGQKDSSCCSSGKSGSG